MDCRPRSGGPPKIVVKKEPHSSPSLPTTSRHRPRKLDLSASIPSSQGGHISRGPHTAREPGMAMQDVGLACLSPGFQTQDPTMREQLQRSISVRDHQRSIIESRLQKTGKGDGPDGVKPSESNLFGSSKSPMTSKKRPAGLSIVPPSASQFANERVVQSAPLNQTFTGRHNPTATRHIANNASNLSSSSQIHHAPATQTNNRLPPISDVFGSESLGSRERERERDNNRNGYYQANSGSTSSQSNHLPPLPSPGFQSHTPNGTGNGHTSQQPAKRPREYRSAEEAVQELSGGREELLPRIVHYGGHQPPTPPSPLPASGNKAPNGLQQGHNGGTSQAQSASIHNPPGASGAGTARRRTRNEYEQDGSPPLGTGPDLRFRLGTGSGWNSTAAGAGTAASAVPHGPFGAGRDSPETQQKKKDEFLGLCSRAWDLFHN